MYVRTYDNRDCGFFFTTHYRTESLGYVPYSMNPSNAECGLVSQEGIYVYYILYTPNKKSYYFHLFRYVIIVENNFLFSTSQISLIEYLSI